MKKAVWSDVYSVQVAEIDNQHKMLIDFINQAYENLEAATLDPQFFERLTAHAQLHFSTEENYFKKFNFTEASSHIEQHNLIKDKITNLQSNYSKTNNPAIIFDTVEFLDDWIFVHIMEYDKKYVDLFTKNGLK